MSNLTWLKKATSKKTKEIIKLSDEYWDVILQDIPDAPEDLKKSPNSLGKLAVVSTLGLMMYLPGNAKEISSYFGRSSHLETGAQKNIKGEKYTAKVSQGIEASSRIITKFLSELEGVPNIGSSDTTEDLRQFMPLFEEMLSDKVARQKKMMEEKANGIRNQKEGSLDAASLLSLSDKPEMMEEEEEEQEMGV